MLALSLGRRSALELLSRGWHLRYAISAAAVLATLITFGTSRDPPAPQTGFMDRWNAVPVRAVALPTKQVKTLSFVPPAPANPVLPEIEGFLQTPMPPLKPAERIADPPPERSPKADYRETRRPDICRGKGRIITRGGKSWRCRR